MEGTTLSHFRILAKIGEGGMGVVYKAEDEHLRRAVALKVLPPDIVGNEDRRARFLREARAAAAISHPNIATIYEVGEADGVVFIAMELVPGATLRGRVALGALTIKDALHIAVQIAEGLAGAHRSHIVHRDLKPENVAMTPEGHVKILDFGLAKVVYEKASVDVHELTRLRTISGEGTEAGKILGTTSYMSPEQARGEAVDARSDIFSFGTVLYEMVTGRPPFQGRTSTDILSSIIRDQPPPAAEINPSVPPELQRIIVECLEKDPRDRYQHTDQLAVDLRKLSRSTDSGVPAVSAVTPPASGASPANWRERLTSQVRRRVVIGGLACALLAAGFGMWQAFRSEPRLQSGQAIIVADFKNRTGRPEFDTALRDAFEQLLSSSTYVDVIRGDRLKSLLGVRFADPLPILDRRSADRSCAGARCAFIAGGIEPDGAGFRLHVELFRAGRSTPLVTRTAAVPSGQEVLNGLHRMAIDLRRTLGEAPGAVALTSTPTTRSLAAYQAYAAADIEAGNGSSDITIGLYKRALAIDSEFVDAYSGIAIQYENLGDWQAARASGEQAYRRSFRLPEHSRLMAEITLLDVQYDYYTEIERLKSYRRLYPYDDLAANLIGTLYMTLDDPVSAEPHLRAAYEIRPDFIDVDNLTSSLLAQGKESEIARVVQDYERRTGQQHPFAILKTLASRSDWKAMLETVDRYHREGRVSRAEATWTKAWTLMRSGRLREALPLLEINRREGIKTQGTAEGSTFSLAWLKLRLGGRGDVLSQEDLARVAKSLRVLRSTGVLAVEGDMSEPLSRLIERFEKMEQSSQSQFVHEELQFARGCLAFVRSDPTTARALIEPLASTTDVALRFHVLGRLYETQRLWAEAAAQYDAVLSQPNMFVFDWPALWSLDRFRLAQVYERLGDKARARELYERFVADWKNGDSDIPELATARQRLAAFGSTP